MKVILPIIFNSESAFVFGTQITDNILITYELIYFLRRKKKDK